MTQVYFFFQCWFTQERSFRICHLFCFANQIFNFAEMENKFKFDNGEMKLETIQQEPE